MSYRVNYGSTKRIRREKRHFFLRAALSSLFFLLLILLVWAQWPEGKQILRSVLITDDAALAIECFMLDLELTGSLESAFRNLLGGF